VSVIGKPGEFLHKKRPRASRIADKTLFTCVSFEKKCKRWQVRQDYRTTFPSFYSIRKKNVFSETFRGGRVRRSGRVNFTPQPRQSVPRSFFAPVKTRYIHAKLIAAQVGPRAYLLVLPPAPLTPADCSTAARFLRLVRSARPTGATVYRALLYAMIEHRF